MQLKIKREEVQRGLIFKTTYYYFHAVAEFTTTELAIIKRQKLGNFQVLYRDLEEGFNQRGDIRDVLVVGIDQLIGRGTSVYHPVLTKARRAEEDLVAACRAFQSRLEEANSFSDGGETVIDFGNGAVASAQPPADDP